MKLNYVFIILIFISILLIVFLGNNHTNPVLKLCSKPIIPFIKTGHFISDVIICRNTVKNLLKEKGESILLHSREDYYKNENKRLRKILKLSDKIEFDKIILAEIIGGDFISNRYFYINKGIKHGIKQNMPVMFVNGIIGKIYTSYDNYSIVETYNNMNYQIGIMNKDQSLFSIAEYYSTNILKANIPNNFSGQLNVNDTVYSSGLANIYPPGIPFGIVKSIIDKRTGEKIFLIKAIQNIPPGNFVFVISHKNNNFNKTKMVLYEYIGSVGWYKIIRKK